MLLRDISHHRNKLLLVRYVTTHPISKEKTIMKTSILALASALAGGVSSQVVNHPNPTHNPLSKKNKMKAFGSATVVHGREQYSRSIQIEYSCADTLGWVDGQGDGCNWYEAIDLPGCPIYGQDAGILGVAADNCCHCAGTGPVVMVTPVPTPAGTGVLSTAPPVVAVTPAPTPAPAEETTGESTSLAPEVENPCTICPNGPDDGYDDIRPYTDDNRTCKELIDDAKLYETGSDDCGLFEFDELQCCYTPPKNPCIICPDGATAGDDFVPEYAANSEIRGTCKELIEAAKQFESGSDACGLYEIDEAFCCHPGLNHAPTPLAVATPVATPPPVMVETPGGNNGKVLGMAIAGVSVLSFMALAIYYLRRMASNANGPQANNAGSVIPTAVVVNMDPEIAEAPFSKGTPLRPDPHASAPPPYAPHASAPPLD